MSHKCNAQKNSSNATFRALDELAAQLVALLPLRQKLVRVLLDCTEQEADALVTHLVERRRVALRDIDARGEFIVDRAVGERLASFRQGRPRSDAEKRAVAALFAGGA